MDYGPQLDKRSLLRRASRRHSCGARQDGYCDSACKMAHRTMSFCCIALLTLLILDAGVVPTSAIRLGSNAKSTGTTLLDSLTFCCNTLSELLRSRLYIARAVRRQQAVTGSDNAQRGGHELGGRSLRHHQCSQDQEVDGDRPDSWSCVSSPTITNAPKWSLSYTCSTVLAPQKLKSLSAHHTCSAA